MMTDASDHLRRLGALGHHDLSRDEHFAHAARALAALPATAPYEDRDIIVSWIDAIRSAVNTPHPAQIVWFPFELRHHILAPDETWHERRYGDWVVTSDPRQGQRVARRREDLIATIQTMRLGYLATVHLGVIGAPWNEMAEHAEELGGCVLDSGAGWWLPRLDAATMFRLRWVDACAGQLTFCSCADDRRCDLGLSENIESSLS